VLHERHQALVRMMMMQAARDKTQGLNHRGLCDRIPAGSPLGPWNLQMERAASR